MSLNEGLLKVGDFVDEQGLFARYRAEIGETEVSLWVSSGPLAEAELATIQTQLRLFAHFDHPCLPTVWDFFFLGENQQWTPGKTHKAGSFCFVLDDLGVQGCKEETDSLVKLSALISALAELHAHGFAHGALGSNI